MAGNQWLAALRARSCLARERLSACSLRYRLPISIMATVPGRKVNSAVDNAVNYFTSDSLKARAGLAMPAGEPVAVVSRRVRRAAPAK